MLNGRRFSARVMTMERKPNTTSRNNAMTVFIHFFFFVYPFISRNATKLHMTACVQMCEERASYKSEPQSKYVCAYVFIHTHMHTYICAKYIKRTPVYTKPDMAHGRLNAGYIFVHIHTYIQNSTLLKEYSIYLLKKA